MILGIGTDIIEIDRIKKAIKNKKFLKMCYTQNELSFLKHERQFASNFAVKESVSKALSTGFSNFYPRDIEVLRTSFGKPYIILYNNAKIISDNLKISTFHVTISHNKNNAIAYVIGEGD